MSLEFALCTLQFTICNFLHVASRIEGSRVFEPEEVKSISDSFSGKYATRDKAIFLLGLCIGSRVSELCQLKVADVWRNGKPVNTIFGALMNAGFILCNGLHPAFWFILKKYFTNKGLYCIIINAIYQDIASGINGNQSSTRILCYLR
jgi:hypothetical protein